MTPYSRLVLSLLLLAGCAFGQTMLTEGVICGACNACQARIIGTWGPFVGNVDAHAPPMAPVDVPAIDALVLMDSSCDTKVASSGEVQACLGKYEQRHTCADKTRILEHDEQEKPKYWCRKVQP